MERSTRNGQVFSPYSADPHPAPEVIHTGVDLAEFLKAAMNAADRRAASLDQDLQSPAHDSDDEDGWEDMAEVDSRPLSPVSELSASRSPSPDGVTVVSSDHGEAVASVDSVSADLNDVDDDTTMPHLLADPSIHQNRRRLHNYKRRRLQRQNNAITSPYAKPLRVKHDQRYREQPVEPADFDADSAYMSAAGAWIGARKTEGMGDASYPLGRTGSSIILPIDTPLTQSRSPKLIVDAHGRIIAILLGRPEDPDWDDVVRDAAKAMERARRAGYASGAFRSKDTEHRRGRYAVLSAGVSFGGGQERSLLQNKSIRRLAGFQSAGMARYAPKLWRYYVDTLSELFEHHAGLEHNFTNSIFPAATFNLGPAVVTEEHADINNCVHGLCGVSSAGSYNHKTSGQIYLKQLKMVIDFPSGSSILIPSAFVDHGNTVLEPEET
ncbi:hypothetical protein DFH06DRAFT_1351030 [Mycena polygramma]|nr:hypothetical protein DFH06DRAFT_1351030 [Mycena polygramma]